MGVDLLWSIAARVRSCFRLIRCFVEFHNQRPQHARGPLVLLRSFIPRSARGLQESPFDARCQGRPERCSRVRAYRVSRVSRHCQGSGSRRGLVGSCGRNPRRRWKAALSELRRRRALASSAPVSSAIVTLSFASSSPVAVVQWPQKQADPGGLRPPDRSTARRAT